MTLSAKTLRIGFQANEAVIAVFAYATLALVFVLDAITPQALAVEIAYEGSVVLAALSGSRKLIVRVLTLTLISDVLGGVVEAFQEGDDLIGIENRILSLISIFIVGALVLSVRTTGEQSGRAAAQTSRHRLDSSLVNAMDRFWSSLQHGQIARAVTEEARNVFGATESIWCPNDRDEPLLTSGPFSSEATARAWPPTDSVASTTLSNLASLSGVETMLAEPIETFAGRSVTEPYYLAIPIASATERFGVLLVSTRTRFADAEVLAAAAQFTLRALSAMQQTRLLEELRVCKGALAAR